MAALRSHMAGARSVPARTMAFANLSLRQLTALPGLCEIHAIRSMQAVIDAGGCFQLSAGSGAKIG
ncbi:hypothetical protein GCM10011326_41290 [Salipiger profundus]|nr:hypothetical protein GCM10011326_41290 [Salipiger profundus]